MLDIILIILGIIAGLCAKGKLSNVLKVDIKKKGIILSACVIQILAQILSGTGFNPVIKYSIIVYLIVYGLIIAGLWVNRHYIGLLIVAAGAFSNAVVIFVNNGRMPVSSGALAKIGVFAGSDLVKKAVNAKHVIADGGTKLSFLSDIIPLRGFIGLGMGVVSVGDLIIGVGIMWLAFEFVKGKNGVQVDS
jgi:hypothetical protein